MKLVIRMILTITLIVIKEVNDMRKMILAIAIFLLTAGIASADNYVGGIPLTTIKEGTVSGGVYFDSYYGTGNQVSYNPIAVDKTFTLPDFANVEWAMLLTTVYCGHMENNNPGWANVTFNSVVLGNESLNVPFVFKNNGGAGYVTVNDHVNRVTSDYMIWYDVTNLVKVSGNTASVHTQNLTDPASGSTVKFDGRIKLITLIAAYNDTSGKKIYYWVNKGHDVDSYNSDDSLGEDYIGSTSFAASLSGTYDARLTAVHLASIDGSYTFNANSIPSGTPQGSYSGSNTWDVAGFNPGGTNTMTYDRSDGFYKIALGILTAKEPAPEKPDLNVTGISVKHNDYTGAWANLNNTVNVTVVNNGAGNAGSFNAALYADGALVDTMPVSSLAAGASTTVGFNWKPLVAGTYSLRGVADPENAVDESNEANNESSKSQLVGYNGYIGDKPLTTYAHGTIKGNLFYTIGDSKYGGKLYPKPSFPPGADPNYTVNFAVTIPGGTTIKFARLYSYWTWSATGTTGKYPVMKLTFDGTEISPEATYDDRKGWGSSYDYPTGTWAYDLTSLVTGSGSHIAVVRNTDTDANAYFCMDGIGLLVVYEDANGKEVEYWINEGADILSTMGSSGGLTPNEATSSSIFSGPIDLSSVEGARLWTVVQSAGHPGTKLLFNDMNWSGVYDGTPYSDLDIDEERDVKAHLVSADNIAKFESPDKSDNGGDYLTPSNAFLVINYTLPTEPDFSISISPSSASIVKGGSASANVNVTSILGYDENVTLVASGIPLNATISFTPEKGKPTYSSTMLVSTNDTTPVGSYPITITGMGDDAKVRSTIFTLKVAEAAARGGNASVSLRTNIIPALAIEVSPSSIDFGELSPGETSGGSSLTVMNKGGYSISVSAEVTDNAEDLFVDGALLNNELWSLYNSVIPKSGDDKPVAKLHVPEDYAGAGSKEGTMMFWAQKS
jgi:hypothetical protein